MTTVVLQRTHAAHRGRATPLPERWPTLVAVTALLESAQSSVRDGAACALACFAAGGKATPLLYGGDDGGVKNMADTTFSATDDLARSARRVNGEVDDNDGVALDAVIRTRWLLSAEGGGGGVTLVRLLRALAKEGEPLIQERILSVLVSIARTGPFSQVVSRSSEGSHAHAPACAEEDEAWIWRVLSSFTVRRRVDMAEGVGTGVICAALEVLGWLVGAVWGAGEEEDDDDDGDGGDKEGGSGDNGMVEGDGDDAVHLPAVKKLRGSGKAPHGRSNDVTRIGGVATWTDHVEELLELLERALHYDSDVDLRLAAARALVHSRVLHRNPRSHTDARALNRDGTWRLSRRVSRRFWLLVLAALQDDDEEVRDHANLAVVSVMLASTRKRSAASSPADDRECDGELGALMTSDHNLRRSAMAIAFASPSDAGVRQRGGGDSDSDADDGDVLALIGVVRAAAGDDASVRDLLRAGRDAMSRRIFEQDQSNLYYEPVAEASAAAAALGRVLASRGDHASASSMALAAVCRLAHSAIGIVQAACADDVQWLGHPTFNPEVFRYAYCGLDAAVQVLGAFPRGPLSGLSADARDTLAVLRVAMLATATSPVSRRADVHPRVLERLAELQDLLMTRVPL